MFYPIFISFFFAAVTLKLILIGLNIKSIKQNFDKVPEQFSSIISPSEHQKAQSYALTKSFFQVAMVIFNALLLLFWLLGGGLKWLSTLTFFKTDIHNGVLFILIFSLIDSLMKLPFNLYMTFVIEQKFGFNKTSPRLFLQDLFKQLILSLVLGIPLLYALLKFLYEAGTYWWVYSWIFIMITQVFLIWAYPQFIAPLFNKFEPIENQNLLNDITNLLKTCNLSFRSFFKMNASIRSSHGNAYFTGFGNNKRIVFFDTLLDSLNSREILAVLAHELGHLKKKHILKSTVMSAIFMLIGLYTLSIVMEKNVIIDAFELSSEKYLQFLLFFLVVPYFTYFLTPILTWASRRNEFEADQFAAEHTNAEDLISALLKLIKDNASSLTPHPIFSKFYFSHPPPKERISFLRSL